MINVRPAAPGAACTVQREGLTSRTQRDIILDRKSLLNIIINVWTMDLAD